MLTIEFLPTSMASPAAADFERLRARRQAKRSRLWTTCAAGHPRTLALMVEPPAQGAPPPQPATPSGRPRWWWWAIAIAAGLVMMLLALPSPPPPPPEPELGEAELRKLAHDPAVIEQGRALWSNCV